MGTLLRDIFYVSRSTGHSDGTLFSRRCVPCVNLLIVLQYRQLFLKGRKGLKDFIAGHFSIVPMSLAPLCCIYRGQIFALEQCQEPFSYRDTCMCPLEETSSCGTLLRGCS